MHKHLVVLFIFFNAFVSFSQQAAISTRTLRVSGATAVFNQNIPIGTLVLNIAENKLFVAKASVADTGTENLTTASYGDLYQWGRAADGHESRISSVASTTAASATAGHGNFIRSINGTNPNWTNFTGEDTLWQSGLNDPCPTGYRIPTEQELDTEREAWSVQNSTGAMNSALKLPLAGRRGWYDGAVSWVGSKGVYWSSTISSGYSDNARGMGFSSTIDAFWSRYGRAEGLSVRCIKPL